MEAKASSMEGLERLMRLRVCRTCALRPAGSEMLGPVVPRSCEPSCPVFRNLPQIYLLSCSISHTPCCQGEPGVASYPVLPQEVTPLHV